MKTLGEFAAPVKLHKDVTAHSKVVIEKERDGGAAAFSEHGCRRHWR
jgi:hypothetical protein